MANLTGVATVRRPLFVTVGFFHFSTSPGRGKTFTTRRGVGRQEMIAIKQCPQIIDRAVVTIPLVNKLCPELTGGFFIAKDNS